MLNINESQWIQIDEYSTNHMYNALNSSKTNTIDNGDYDPILITTRDSYTLTHGPTIFLTDNVLKVANLYIKQSNIPSTVIDNIKDKIEYNNQLIRKIDKQEKTLEDIEKSLDTKKSTSSDTSSHSKKDKSSSSSSDVDKKNSEITKITKEIDTLKSMIKSASLNDTFIPNTIAHLKKWNINNINENLAFKCDICDDIVLEIMTLKNIDDCLKILLLMGIGVFMDHENKIYTEIMKRLADTQKLYLIIASSDYVYGTNYQFCHGYISKDMNLSQEKIIQAIGRIGRNSNQKQYTARFRCDGDIQKLFTYQKNKPEIINMNLLFNSEINVSYQNDEYIYT
jgi:hypothetical protein